MQIKEVKDHNWIIEIEAGHIIFDLSTRRAYFHKRRTRVFKEEIDQTPTREWHFDQDNISGLDVFLVIMKSLHL
ncbi:MAG: hypothetical protein K9J13_17515 [Saprospiraceae bacterium]|nr:hypothetical protein [Saprospiraceae bacterium]